MKLKKILCMALCLALCMAMVPATAWAATQVSIGGVSLATATPYYVNDGTTSNDPSISWNAYLSGTNLTLRDLDVNNDSSGIEANGDITITLIGENMAYTQGEDKYGIKVDGTLTIDGKGSLEAKNNNIGDGTGVYVSSTDPSPIQMKGGTFTAIGQTKAVVICGDNKTIALNSKHWKLSTGTNMDGSGATPSYVKQGTYQPDTSIKYLKIEPPKDLITVSPTSLNFGTEKEGYGAITPLSFEIEKKLQGDLPWSDITATSLSSDSAFVVSGSISDNNATKTSLSVKPKDNLAPGTYSETLSVQVTGLEVATVTAAFIVTATPQPTSYYVPTSVTTGLPGEAVTTVPTDVRIAGGTATATITSANAKEMIRQAKERQSAEFVFEVSNFSTWGTPAIGLQLDKSVVENIVNETDAVLTLKTEHGRITIDRETLQQIAAEAKGDTVTIQIEKAKTKTPAHEKIIGQDGQIYNLTITSGGTAITQFKGKVKVKLTVPNPLKEKQLEGIHLSSDIAFTELNGVLTEEASTLFYVFETDHFSRFALAESEIVKAYEAETLQQVKTLLSGVTMTARSALTPNKNIRITLQQTDAAQEAISRITALGYTVKYKYYRSVKKSADYKARLTKATKTYISTSGKEGVRYYYKARILVYDRDGSLAASTALTRCKYASRKCVK